MRAVKIARTLVVVAGCLVGNAASAQVAPEEVSILYLSSNGRGCPPGTVEADVRDDGLHFIGLTGLVAQVGPGIPPVESRRDCQVSVLLGMPDGYTYAIAGVAYRFRLALGPGSRARARDLHYYRGMAALPASIIEARGPRDGDWVLDAATADDAQQWIPCGAARTLNVSAQVLVQRDGAAAGAAALDGDVVYRLAFRPCTP